MEQVHNNDERVDRVKTPELLKQEAFASVMKSILFRINQERETLSSFNFGGKEIIVDSVAGGVKALGQLPSRMSFDIYNETIAS